MLESSRSATDQIPARGRKVTGKAGISIEWSVRLLYRSGYRYATYSDTAARSQDRYCNNKVKLEIPLWFPSQPGHCLRVTEESPESERQIGLFSLLAIQLQYTEMYTH